MNLEEFYAQTGGDYADTVRRLYNEKMVGKFVRKYVDDPTCAELKAAVAAEDWETAFRGAHTLKGVCVNLGFDGLSQVSSELTEMLRTGSFDGIDELYEKTAVEYRRTIDALSKFRQD